MHENVKRFFVEGEVAYQYLSKVRLTLEETIEDEMRTKGYVPVLDVDTEVSQHYDPETEKFKIKVSMIGAYLGEEEVCKVAGLMFGKRVMKSTPKDKLTQS